MSSTSGRVPPLVKPKFTFYSLLLTILACLGGLLFGYDTGVMSSVMLFLPKNAGMKPMKTIWQELIVSITPGLAALSSLAAGKLSDVLGRRPIILFASIIFFLGAVVCGVAPEKYTLLAGRALLGIAVGFASMIVPVYISEAAPSYIRGALITVYQIMIAIGFIVANLVAVFCSQIDPVHMGWRLIFGFAAIPSVIQLIGFLYLKDTPRYLYKTGQKELCKDVLSQIYGNNREWVQYDLDEIRDAIEEDAKASKQMEDSFVPLRILHTPHVLKALVLGCSMQMFQQLVGVNTLLYYTAKILRSAGVEDDITNLWIALGISVVQAVTALLPMKLIEQLGRRPVLLVSLMGIIVSLLLMGGTFVLINKDSQSIDISNRFNGVNESRAKYEENFDFCSSMTSCDSCTTSPHCGHCYSQGDIGMGQCLPLAYHDSERSSIGHCDGSTTEKYIIKTTCTTKYTVIPVVIMLIYLISFSFGMGPMPWVFNAEIYPLWARSTCVSLATFTNWIFNLFISLTFLTLGEAITKYGAFFLYAAFGTIGWFIFFFFVPETKGLPIEEVEKLFMTKEQRKEHHRLHQQKELEMAQY